MKMGKKMDYKQLRDEKLKEIESILGKYLPEPSGYQKKIMEAMEYSLMAGGKRLRPMLMNETYVMFGGADFVIQPFMAAMEMIHTYSLVHDDLPAMDNDDYRRGRKTTHVVYGEAMGILAGDALLNFAFETATKTLLQYPEKSSEIGKALVVLSKKAGIYGMIGGQVVDVLQESKNATKERLDFIHELKTAALIEGSMMIGAILAGASEQEVSTVEQIAKKIGIAFQIQDDILDVTSTKEVLGKPVFSDEKNDKKTYVTMVGMEKAKEAVSQLSMEAIELLHQLPCCNSFLEELLISLIHREK